MVESEAAAYQYVRDFLSFLPSNCFDKPPVVNPGLEPEITGHDLELDSIVPDSDNMAYDMHEVLLRIFDDGDFLDVAAQAGQAIITGYARVDGRTVGVVANQPMHMSGAIDNEASDKAARFIRFSDAFDIPLVFVVDTPGFLPGVEQEKNGIIKRGGRFLYAVVEADVPKVTITIRKSYGGAYAVMGSKQLTADLNFAWPTARIAVIGADGAAQLLMKRFLTRMRRRRKRSGRASSRITTSTWRSRGSPPSAGSSMPSSTRMRPGCCCASRCTCCGISSCGGGWAASTA